MLLSLGGHSYEIVKTHLHAMIATAINVVRTLAWLDEEPLAPTRTSKFAALFVA